VDWALLHLSVHHIPVVLSIAGGLAALAGLLLRRSGVVHFGAVSLLLAAGASPVAYLSGRAAASALGVEIGGGPGSADPLRGVVDAHAAYGLAATMALVAAGAAAVAWLRGRRGRGVTAGLVLLGLLAAGLSAAAGREGGAIRHGPRGSAALKHLDGRDVLVGVGSQIGEDAVQLHDHPEELLVEGLVDDELAHGPLAGAQAGQ